MGYCGSHEGCPRSSLNVAGKWGSDEDSATDTSAFRLAVLCSIHKQLWSTWPTRADLIIQRLWSFCCALTCQDACLLSIPISTSPNGLVIMNTMFQQANKHNTMWMHLHWHLYSSAKGMTCSKPRPSGVLSSGWLITCSEARGSFS